MHKRHTFSMLGAIVVASWGDLVRLSIFTSVGDMVFLRVTRVWFGISISFQISYGCCLWLWVDACWFLTIPLSKWSPASNFGFFSFQTLTLGVHYLCVWVKAYWFPSTALSKRPPGDPISFVVVVSWL